ncbi:hypothetical protein AC1031_002199 [Aphanomyces cochlioides]|nr:hypothetical protein AC1031_002199 [Aphanomyces cochlioides]
MFANSLVRSPLRLWPMYASRWLSACVRSFLRSGSFVAKVNNGHSTIRDKTTSATAKNSAKIQTQRFYLRQRDEIQTLRQEIEHLTGDVECTWSFTYHIQCNPSVETNCKDGTSG